MLRSPRPTLLFLAALAACAADDKSAPLPLMPVEPSATPSPFTVSAAYLGSIDSITVDNGGDVSRGVVYVALPQGAIPGADSVMVRASETGSAFTATVVYGGLDPITIEASTGESLVA